MIINIRTAVANVVNILRICVVESTSLRRKWSANADASTAIRYFPKYGSDDNNPF